MDKPTQMLDCEIDALLSKLKTLPEESRNGLVSKIQERLSEISCSSNDSSSLISKFTENDHSVDLKTREIIKNSNHLANETSSSSYSTPQKRLINSKARIRQEKKKNSSLGKYQEKKSAKNPKKNGKKQDIINKRRSSVLPVRYTNFTDVPDFLVPQKKNDIPHVVRKEDAFVESGEEQAQEFDDTIASGFPETSNNSVESKNDTNNSSEFYDTDDISNMSISSSKNQGLAKKKSRFKKIAKKDDRTCGLCSRTYVNPSYLRIHMRKHTGEKPYHCEICNKKFSQRSSLWVHNKRHEGKFDHKCTMCDYKSVLKIDLLRHTSKHTGKKIFICEQCGKMFTTDMRLKDHIRHVHERSETHVCDKCGFATHRADNLRRHIAVKHSDDEYFKCPVCGDVLKQRSTFIVHLRRHTGERPHICKECGKGFKSLSQVAVHRRIHREGQHVCPECNYKFKTKHHLNRHSVVHTGAKPYSCTYCSYSCNVKGNINKHMKAVHKLVNFSFRKQKNVTNNSAPPLSDENAAIARGTQVANEFLERISLRKDEQLTIEALQKEIEKPSEPREEIPVIKNKTRSTIHINKRPKIVKQNETSSVKDINNIETELLIEPACIEDLTLERTNTDDVNCAEVSNSDASTITINKEISLPICSVASLYDENAKGITVSADGNNAISVQSTCVLSTDSKVVKLLKTTSKNQNQSNVLFLSVKEVVDENFGSANNVTTTTIPISNLEQENITDKAPTIYVIMDP